MISLTSPPLPEHSDAMDANPCGSRQAVESKQLDANDINVTKGFTKAAMEDLNIDHADFFKFSFAVLVLDAEAPVIPADPTTNATAAGFAVAAGFALAAALAGLWTKGQLSPRLQVPFGKNKHSTVALDGAFGLSLSSFFSLSPLPFPFPFPFSELAPLAPSAFALAFGFGLGTALPGKPLVSSSLLVPLPPPDFPPFESVLAAKADFGGGCGFPLGCNAALILSSF